METENRRLHPAFALASVIVGWYIGVRLRGNGFPSNITSGTFTPNSNDTYVALLNCSIILVTWFAAGWILFYKEGEIAVWVVLSALLLMLVLEYFIKGTGMALSLNYDYWVYVARSLPIGKEGTFLMMPAIGIGGGTSSALAYRWIRSR